MWKVRFTDAFRTTKCVRKTHYFPNSITKNSPREAVKIPVGTNMLEKRSEKLGDHDSRLSRHNSQIPCYFWTWFCLAGNSNSICIRQCSQWAWSKISHQSVVGGHLFIYIDSAMCTVHHQDAVIFFSVSHIVSFLSDFRNAARFSVETFRQSSKGTRAQK